MSLSIDIIPISDTLDMYGEPEPSSAYSLAGHVSVSVSSPHSMFERRRTARILLHSITLTFEGQAEIINEHTGYAAARLCSVTREIAPSEPVEMTNEGHEDSDEPCVWNVVFDLPVPGWLPPSSLYGREAVGVRYSLFAEAKFSHVGESQSSTWSLATLCSPFRSRVKTQDARKDIQLRRFICCSEDILGTSTLQQTVTYLVNASVAPRPGSDLSRFPAEVLSKLQVLASVPEYVDMERNELPLVLRMRTKDLEAEECKRIQVTSVSANVVQMERYRTRVPSDYWRRFPIPPPAKQPPHMPLLDPHPISNVYEVGLGINCCEDNASRSFSLLPRGVSGVHSLGENNYPFANDADAASPESATWYTLESCVPFVHQAPDDKAEDWAGPAVLRPSVNSPLVNVVHEVAIELTCTYTLPGTEKVVSERLAFGIPIRFAHFAPDPQRRCITPPPEHTPRVSAREGSPTPSLPAPMPYAPNLPPYSHLFDRNGDRKIDYSTPLPLYTPRSPYASSSSLELDVGGDETQPLLSTPLVS
ncbi:hypothetical protein LshimejAT787_0203050 [Lyophyllum shimeji]|uniref:Uncharacterized protein n=1 Tax=Lyophyllum shimeji TaxID=47721 RepID=A0A9P3PEY9_LYOSH|nr:hypothetical protein LshimejAT787_0203050 [Lyophyllum shimeji]